MTAALQKATHLFGAKRVFHVFAEDYKKKYAKYAETIEEIRIGFEEKLIRIIDMGPEPGRSFILNNLDTLRDSPSKTDFVLQQLRYVDTITENLDKFDSLPFSVLTGLNSTQVEFLQIPLVELVEIGLIEVLPKIELHCHLGGFATHGELLKQVRAAATSTKPTDFPEEPPLPESWPEPKNPIELGDYMKLGDATGSKLLKDPGCLEKQIELFYQALQNDRVIYAEIRCSPANYSTGNRSAWQVLEEIRSHFSIR